MEQPAQEAEIYGSGEPIIFVNGLYNDKVAWCRLAVELAPKWKIHLFNFPGQGMDRRSPLKTMNEHVDYLRTVMEAWNLAEGNAIVAGLSSGADIIRMAHCLGGVPMKSLVLFGSNPGGLGVFWEQVTEAFLRSLATGGIGGFARQSMHLLFSPTHFSQNRLTAKSIEDAYVYCYKERENDLETLINVLVQDPDIDAPSAHFSAPAFLLWGRSDSLVPESASKAYVSRCKTELVKSEYVPGGHSFAFENPKETAALMNRLLGDIAVP